MKKKNNKSGDEKIKGGKMEKTRDAKQSRIDAWIDKQGDAGEMGQDLLALTALQARISFQELKPNKYITDFSESLGFKKHMDTAIRILADLYPANRMYWGKYDQIYKERIENSAWIQANLKGEIQNVNSV